METANDIDLEVKALVSRAYRRAKDCMQSNIDVLHKMASVLLEKENLDGDELQRLIFEAQANQYLKEDEPSIELPYQSVEEDQKRLAAA